MADGSIYVPRDEKFTGGSPQVMYESFWVQGREARLKRRGVFAAIGLIGGVLLSIRFSLPSFWTAVTCAGIVAAAMIGDPDPYTAACAAISTRSSTAK